MINQKPFLKTVFRYFKTEPVSQYIFSSMVPEKSHLIPQRIYLPGIRFAGNSVFMIFRMPECPQILPNPVEFGPQQPCTQIRAVPASKIQSFFISQIFFQFLFITNHIYTLCPLQRTLIQYLKHTLFQVSPLLNQLRSPMQAFIKHIKYLTVNFPVIKLQ